MSGHPRLPRLMSIIALVAMLLPLAADAQSRGQRPQPRPGGAVARRPAPAVRVPSRPGLRTHVVFIGGYFYDPFFGPYPWWPRAMYPYQYFPRYDNRSEVRVLVTPKTAAVYVDGFYAGIVDDFDGTFQSLPLPPGGHTIVLYLEGYRTARQSLYLRPGATLKLHDTLERLPAGVTSEPPTVAAPLPSPPAGSTTMPRTAPPATVSSTTPQTVEADAFGALELAVQPTTATVTIDGARWVSSDQGRFLVDLPEGTHHIEVFEDGYARFARDVDIGRDETVLLNVSLVRPS